MLALRYLEEHCRIYRSSHLGTMNLISMFAFIVSFFKNKSIKSVKSVKSNKSIKPIKTIKS